MSSKFVPVKIDLNGLKDGLTKDELIKIINDINSIQNEVTDISIFNIPTKLLVLSSAVSDIKSIVSK